MSNPTRVHLHLQHTYTALDQGAYAYTHDDDRDKARQLLDAARSRLGRAIADLDREDAAVDEQVAVALAELAALPTTSEEDNR